MKTTIQSMTDEAIEARLHALDEAKRAARGEMIALGEERDRRANARELAALATKLGPEKMRQLAALAQRVEPAAAATSGDARSPG